MQTYVRRMLTTLYVAPCNNNLMIFYCNALCTREIYAKYNDIWMLSLQTTLPPPASLPPHASLASILHTCCAAEELDNIIGGLDINIDI